MGVPALLFFNEAAHASHSKAGLPSKKNDFYLVLMCYRRITLLVKNTLEKKKNTRDFRAKRSLEILFIIFVF
jgi:hypothetical protein